MLGFTVIKDLVVDMEPFFAQYRSIKPYLINDDHPPSRARALPEPGRPRPHSTTPPSASCARACTTVVPDHLDERGVRRAGGDRQGPPLHLRPRDQGADERLAVLNDKSGVWRCRTIFNCTDACPRGIKVTRAIEQVKRTMLYERG